MQPETIVTWFYPGEDIGHEFVYSNSEEQELAQVKHHTMWPQRGTGIGPDHDCSSWRLK